MSIVIQIADAIYAKCLCMLDNDIIKFTLTLQRIYSDTLHLRLC